MSATDLAAWWGAAVATLLFVWDIFKWKRTGPIVHVSVSPNMKTYGQFLPGVQDKIFVVVEVTNTGDRKTTLTHLVGLQYTSLFNKIRGKKNKNFLVAIPALSQPLPFSLGPRERWLGGIEQNKELEEMARSGLLFCGVYHSSGKKPVLGRVVMPTEIAT